MNSEQPTFDTAFDIYMPPLMVFVIITFSRESFLSKNGFHYRDQRIVISHKFNFGYGFSILTKIEKIQQ